MYSTETLPTSAAAASARPAVSWSGQISLEHWGLIRARGADAASFLHTQLTNSFTSLSDGSVRLAGFCSAKGRLQASFLGWQLEPDHILLACHASVLAATLKRLSMFVLRSKCRLTDAAGDADAAAPVCRGLVGAAAERALATASLSKDWRQRSDASGSLLRLPAVHGIARAVWVAAPGAAVPGGDEHDGSSEAPTLDAWRWLEVHSGIPSIEAETVDRFVPQMINFELIGGVDFQKGCYPGQEVVARSQYRGTIKRRMFLFEAAGVCVPGQEVFHSADAGQPAGMIVNAAPRPTGSGDSALAEIRLAALAQEGSLHLDGVDGPLLTPIELPYTVPALDGDAAH